MRSWDNAMLGPRAREAFLLRLSMSGAWSIRVADGAPLTVLTQRTGRSWFTIDGAEPLGLEPGNALIVATPTPYVLSHLPGVTPDITIGPGQMCAGGGRDLSEDYASGVRAWGNDPEGPDRLLVGTYQSAADLGTALTQKLPAFALVPVPDPSIVELMDRGAASDGFAQDTVLDRMLDLYLTTLLRGWAEAKGAADGEGMCGASPEVARLLERVRLRPDAPWTLEVLASHAGLSKAALVRRMRQETGLAPMAYVAQTRIEATSRLLDTTALTIEAIARQVGYSSPFSLSVAFKRARGMSPARYRASSSAPDS